jgi:hypothetical protein
MRRGQARYPQETCQLAGGPCDIYLEFRDRFDLPKNYGAGILPRPCIFSPAALFSVFLPVHR